MGAQWRDAVHRRCDFNVLLVSTPFRVVLLGGFDLKPFGCRIVFIQLLGFESQNAPENDPDPPSFWLRFYFFKVPRFLAFFVSCVK